MPISSIQRRTLWVVAAVLGLAGLALGIGIFSSRKPQLGLDLMTVGGKVESETSSSVALKEIVFSFYQGREASINAVVINTASDAIVADPKRMPKEVSILASETSASDGFSRVKATSLSKDQLGEQTISFSPTKAKYLKVRFLSTYGGAFADVKEIRISGDPSILTGQPVDVALSELGGQIESITGEYGPGYAGRSLIDGRPETAWQASADGPQEIVLSFFGRQPARIASAQIALPANAATAPKSVEIWTSMNDAAEGFTKVAAADLPQQPAEQTMSFAPVEARLVKLVLSPSAQGGPPAIGEIRVFEAETPGYTSLLKRNPEMLAWKPRPAAVATLASPTPASTPAAQALTTEKANLASTDLGGVIEGITGEYGPGLSGNRLIDGRGQSAWTPTTSVFPQEITFSFFNRQPALINSMIISSGPSPAKEIDVWTSMSSPTGPFQRVAAQTLNQAAERQTVSFDPVEARYVKLRILSGYGSAAPSIRQIQILEAQRAGYDALAKRHPDIAMWKNSPRYAAQRGIEWLQTATMDWQAKQNCFGCHVQSQVMMGLAISKAGKYAVSDNCVEKLTRFVEASQTQDGSISGPGGAVVRTQFAGMALAEVDQASEAKRPALLKTASWLLTQQQPDGGLPIDHVEGPIDQGTLMTTANTLSAFIRAFGESGDNRYQQAAQRALAWIASAKTETTQDKIFQVIALSRFGNDRQKQIAQRTVGQLKSEQKDDGGWQETGSMRGSNAFATGQVLYAFKQAGVSIESPEFAKGVKFLLTNQKENGAWPSMNSQSGRPSEFAPTMWAVIGLAGSFQTAECAEVERQPDRIVIRMCSRALFDFDRYDLKPDALAVLASIKSSYIDADPAASVEIDGHTDDVGSVPYNLKLSLDRAQSVAQWMRQQGVEGSRLKTVGFGKAKPRCANTSEEDRACNRRVEISILGVPK